MATNNFRKTRPNSHISVIFFVRAPGKEPWAEPAGGVCAPPGRQLLGFYQENISVLLCLNFSIPGDFQGPSCI